MADKALRVLTTTYLSDFFSYLCPALSLSCSLFWPSWSYLNKSGCPLGLCSTSARITGFQLSTLFKSNSKCYFLFEAETGYTVLFLLARIFIWNLLIWVNYSSPYDGRFQKARHFSFQYLECYLAYGWHPWESGLTRLMPFSLYLKKQHTKIYQRISHSFFQIYLLNKHSPTPYLPVSTPGIGATE